MTIQLLDNIFWNALQGTQANFAIGHGPVRRYAPEFCPIAGFEQAGAPDFSTLAALCAPDEEIYCDGLDSAIPPNWRVKEEAMTARMVWDAPVPANDQAPDAVRLGPGDAEAAFELAMLTKPGPFGRRSIELGDYFGYFEHGQLVAMAGERLAADGFREISGVCTHPSFAGLGMARRLIAKLARRQLMRGERPFLHVPQSNVAAHGLYRRMGFRDHSVSPTCVIARIV